jgi:hypothetical protein
MNMYLTNSESSLNKLAIIHQFQLAIFKEKDIPLILVATLYNHSNLAEVLAAYLSNS